MPHESDIHCIADNYATHSHPNIKVWLATRPRSHMHFIPTYSSWLIQVERLFSLITDKVIRRGSFVSVKQLIQRVDHFVTAVQYKLPVVLVDRATADSILEKLHQLCSRISGQDTRSLRLTLLWSPTQNARPADRRLSLGMQPVHRARLGFPSVPIGSPNTRHTAQIGIGANI